jgi:hypothetical protein
VLQEFLFHRIAHLRHCSDCRRLVFFGSGFHRI